MSPGGLSHILLLIRPGTHRSLATPSTHPQSQSLWNLQWNCGSNGGSFSSEMQREREMSLCSLCGKALAGNIWAVSELQLSSEYLEIRSHLWCQPTSSPMIETHTQHPQYWTRTIYNTVPGQSWWVVGGMIWPLDVDQSPSMWWEVMVTRDKLSLMCNWRKPNLASGPVH